MIKENGIIDEYPLIVYPIPFVVVVGDIEKEVNSRYKPVEDKYNWISKPGEACAASTYTVRSRKDNAHCVLIWYASLADFTSATCTHECDHAALEIFNFVGASITYDNQEPYCYLAGALARFATMTYRRYEQFINNLKQTEDGEQKTEDSNT